ncbi:MAG: ferredoxin--nitrite reductase [Campylobacterota bacterium]|nr:ferredoxin--nitrite reductase [Campylobacterota bacterium]
MQKLQQAFDERSKKQNKIEKIKELHSPKESYEKLNFFAQNGYSSIPAEDKSYFLKCFGIYDRPATPEKFMIRVRVPGGHLNAKQAKVIGELAKEFGNDYIDITTRAQIELRYINIEDIPKILKSLNDIGVSTFQTGVDNFRNIVNDPLDGDGFDNILPSQNLLLKLQSQFLENYEWISTLPRKFNTSISGSLVNRCNVYGHDCCFILAQKDGVYGYNMFLGGKVGVIASNADIFLKDENEVILAYEAITRVFKKYGFRDNRNKNRIHFLIESVGMDVITTAIKDEASKEFATAGETLTTLDNPDADHGKIALRDGSYALHVVVPSGVFTGSALIRVANLANEYGNSEVRFDVSQSIYIMGVKEVDKVLKDELFYEYKSVNTPYYNNIIACAGTEHCPFGVIPNKPDAIEMAEYLSKNVPLDENSRLRMYWSACVKGCGLHSLGDIGFEGCKAKLDGENVYGVHILVGGKISGHSEEAHSVLKSIPLKHSKYYVESLAREYKKLKLKGESFEKFNERILANYSPSAIGFMMVLLAYLKQNKIDIDFGFKKDVMCGKNENFEIFDIGVHLYYALFEKEPYEVVENFAPNSELGEFTCSDEKLQKLLHVMISKESRVVVFSEIVNILKIT